VRTTSSRAVDTHTVIDALLRRPWLAASATLTSRVATGATQITNTHDGLGGGLLQPPEKRCVAAVGAQLSEYVGAEHHAGAGVRMRVRNPPLLRHASSPTWNVNHTTGSVDPNWASSSNGWRPHSGLTTDGRRSGERRNAPVPSGHPEQVEEQFSDGVQFRSAGGPKSVPDCRSRDSGDEMNLRLTPFT
jgi:hypothetical protein